VPDETNKQANTSSQGERKGAGATHARFCSLEKRPPANKAKLNKTKLHTDTYLRTYTEGQNKTKQSKTTKDCGSNSEDLIRPCNSDVLAER